MLVEKLAEVLRDWRKRDGALISNEKSLHDEVLGVLQRATKETSQSNG